MQVLQRVEKLTRSRIIAVIIAFISCGIFAFLINNVFPDTNSEIEIMEPRFPSIAKLYPEALDEAQSWREDAYMVFADVSHRQGRISTAFAFGTMEDPNLGLLVYFRESENGYVVKSEESEGAGRVEPRPGINREDWAVDSIEVAQQVFLERGSDFLKAHPEVDEALLQLTRVSGAAAENTGLEAERIVWVMHYYQITGYELRVYVDPITGSIIGEEFFEPRIDR